MLDKEYILNYNNFGYKHFFIIVNILTQLNLVHNNTV